jgi:riboflavin kinase / FMN adenylyltransferase
VLHCFESACYTLVYVEVHMVHLFTHLAQLPQLPTMPSGSVVALGMFDGVHRGHQQVLATTVDRARALGAVSAVFTFANHPKPVVQAHVSPQADTPASSPSPIRLLTPALEKSAYIEQLGLDWIVMPPFDSSLQQMSADAFEQTVIADGLRAIELLVGEDFRYGANRQGTAQRLIAAGQRLGFTVTVVPLLTDHQAPSTVYPAIQQPTKLGSRRIRDALAAGELAQANDWLGRAYRITGTVVVGEQRGGALLGTPTANLALPVDKLIPKPGVYAGQATLNGTTYLALANMGVNPTFAELTTPRVEVHLLDYHGPAFYGEVLTFACLHYLRPEQRFEGLAHLKQQIALDCQQAHSLLEEVQKVL